jgi:hypothetical protein
MQREATRTSVTLPPKDSKGNTYSFSFAAQRESLAYASGSLEPLSVQLGEVKAICDVLFAAKVNSLDNLRRERVSEDDSKGPQTDYLTEKSVTNELAVLTPYELTFRCFSTELAAVLSGFGNSPSGLVVKTINVEAAPAAPASEQAPAAVPAYATPPPYTPPPMRGMEAPRSAEAAFASRYGLGPGRPGPRPTPQPAPYVQPAAAAPASKGGLPLVLDEKQLKVTLMVNVVKLVPSK